MACFHLMRNGYDAEVMIPIYVTGTDLILSLPLLVNIVLCDLYLDSHILLYLIITLLLIIHSNCIHCLYVREYHAYSLTHNKSLL